MGKLEFRLSRRSILQLDMGNPEDIDFESWYWLFGARSNSMLNASYSVDSAGLLFRFSTGMIGQVQYRPYLYDERSSPTTVHPYKIADYEYNAAYWSLGTNMSWRPFKTSDIFPDRACNIRLQGKSPSSSMRGSTEAAPQQIPSTIGIGCPGIPI